MIYVKIIELNCFKIAVQLVLEIKRVKNVNNTCVLVVVGVGVDL